MSINVTYEYTCDICGGEAWPKEERRYTHGVLFETIQPRRVDHICEYLLCPACRETAMEALRERIKPN